jgi:hypothetical protein
MARRLDDWITSYLAYTDNTEPPTMYHEWIALSVIAGVLQRKCFLRFGMLTWYPNLYVVLVGPSGRCRKGTAMSIGADFLRQMGVKMAAEAITREALIQELAAATTDAFINGQAVKHASLTIYSQELTVFLGYNNLALLSDVTDWYDCRDVWTYRTKKSGTDEIVGVWVNLIGATTPSLIREALPRDAIGGGLASRIIFVYEEEKRQTVPCTFLTSDQENIYKDLIYDLTEIMLMEGQFKVSPDFITRWVDWYEHADKNPKFTDPNFEGYETRRANHVMKLCIILSASTRDDMIIDAAVLDRAVDLLERTEEKMPRVFAGYGASPLAETMTRMMDFIARRGSVTEREIAASFYADVPDRQILFKMFETMKSMGFCTITAQPGSGTQIVFNRNFRAPS